MLEATSFEGLFVDIATLQIGDISVGQYLDVDVRLSNQSNTSILVDEIKTSCGCTAVQFKPSALGPGNVSAVKIRVTAGGLPGPLASTLVLKVRRDGENNFGRVRLRLQGRAIGPESPQIISTPNRIHWGTASLNSKPRRVIKLWGDPAILSSIPKAINYHIDQPEIIVPLNLSGTSKNELLTSREIGISADLSRVGQALQNDSLYSSSLRFIDQESRATILKIPMTISITSRRFEVDPKQLMCTIKTQQIEPFSVSFYIKPISALQTINIQKVVTDLSLIPEVMHIRRNVDGFHVTLRLSPIQDEIASPLVGEIRLQIEDKDVVIPIVLMPLSKG